MTEKEGSGFLTRLESLKSTSTENLQGVTVHHFNKGVVLFQGYLLITSKLH